MAGGGRSALSWPVGLGGALSLTAADFQTAPLVNPIRSRSVDLEYVVQQCEDIFGQKMVPDTLAVNQYYGGASPKSSNIVFVDASDDP